MATARVVVATVPAGILRTCGVRVSWLQLWTAVATVEGAGTDRLGLSIVVAAWDSCCYGTRIEQAGSDPLYIHKTKNNKKN